MAILFGAEVSYEESMEMYIEYLNSKEEKTGSSTQNFSASGTGGNVIMEKRDPAPKKTGATIRRYDPELVFSIFGEGF